MRLPIEHSILTQRGLAYVLEETILMKCKMKLLPLGVTIVRIERAAVFLLVG